MCTREHPCGGQLHVVLVMPTFILEECLNDHSYRTDAPPPEPGRFKDTPYTRGHRPPIVVPGNLAPKAKGCRFCGRSVLGACKRHGGVTDQQRQKLWREARRAGKASA